jgi:ABC-type transport system involved in multi-copper enzyme maturation permease subunit
MTVSSLDLGEAPARAQRSVHSQPVTLRRAVSSEWIKFRTLRSTIAVLAAAMLGMIVIALLVAYNTRHLSANLQPDDVVASSPLQGYFLGQLLVGSLGVLFVSGEYSTGMIRSTFAAVPRRLPALWAKLLIFIAVTAVAMIGVSIAAFAAAEALLSNYRPGYSIADPGVARVVIGTGVYLVLVGVIGSAIAWIVRSTPGSLVTYIAVVLILPVLFGNVLGNWGKHVAQFLPSEAGGSFIRSLHQPITLTPWAGLGVMIAWTALAIGIAAVQLRRRDA